MVDFGLRIPATALVRGDFAPGCSGWLRFGEPLAVLRADRLSEVLPVCREAERAAAEGLYAVGFISYEAAPAFDPALVVRDGCPLPLAWFGVFRNFRPAPSAAEGPGLDPLRWEAPDSRSSYDDAIRRRSAP